ISLASFCLTDLETLCPILGLTVSAFQQASPIETDICPQRRVLSSDGRNNGLRRLSHR
ncbi:hypothetical protein AVEN_38177-1, partial [Araneus ventricosus]